MRTKHSSLMDKQINIRKPLMLWFIMDSMHWMKAHITVYNFMTCIVNPVLQSWVLSSSVADDGIGCVWHSPYTAVAWLRPPSGRRWRARCWGKRWGCMIDPGTCPPAWARKRMLTKHRRGKPVATSNSNMQFLQRFLQPVLLSWMKTCFLHNSPQGMVSRLKL